MIRSTCLSILLVVAALSSGCPSSKIQSHDAFADTHAGDAGDDTATTDTADDVQISPDTGLDAADISEPALAILAPEDGAVLLARDDEDPATEGILETTFTVAADVDAGLTLVIRCAAADSAAAPLVVGQHAVEAPSETGEYTIPVGLRVDLLGASQRCALGVSEQEGRVSPAIVVTVALPAPLIVLTTPADGFATKGPELTVSGTATGIDGQLVEIAVADDQGVVQIDITSEDPVENGVFGAAVALETGGAPLPDGTYQVRVDAQDTFGNRASDRTDGVRTAMFVLDRSAPELTWVAPPATLSPGPEIGDEDPERLGFQTTAVIEVGAEDAPGEVEVCLATPTAAAVCQLADPATARATFFGITLEPGDNTLSATATDGLGNASETSEHTVLLAYDAPRVSFVAPADGLITGAATVNVSVEVREAAVDRVLPNATVTLVRGGATIATGTSGLDGRVAFADVALDGGANVFEATATAGDGEGAAAPILIVRKTDRPAITFATLTDGAVLNLASAECVAGETDCRTEVELTTQALEPGMATSLSVSCGGAVVIYDAVAATARITFEDVVLAHGGPCSLAAAATDSIGQLATAGPILVRIDRVAPVVHNLGLPIAVGPEDDLLTDTQHPGIQVAFAPTVEGLEAGQEITLTLAVDGGAPFTETFALAESVAEGAPREVSLGTLTLPDGTLAVTGTAADAADNPATPVTAEIYVTPAEAEVRIVGPGHVPNIACESDADCAVGGVCTPDGCAVPVNATTDLTLNLGLTGVMTGTDNLRICGDHPSATGADCATPGFRELARADIESDVASVAISGLLPEGFQVLVAEVRRHPSSTTWLSSWDNGTQLFRERDVFVDTEAPSVVALSVPSDSETPAEVLNIAEQTEPGRRYLLRVESTEDGRAMFVVNGAAAPAVDIVGGTADAVLALREGANTVLVSVTDVVGNDSGSYPEPALGLTVDTLAPELSFTQPSGPVVLAGDSLDVRLYSDEAGAVVTLLDGGALVGEETVDASNEAVFPDATYGTLSDGDHVLSASVSDSAGNETVATTSPETVVVDTLPPSLTLVAPADGSSLGDADDAQPAVPGYQVEVRFDHTAQSPWEVWLASGCAPDYTGCDTAVRLATGDGTGTTETVNVTVPVFEVQSYHQVEVVVRDTAGNETTATSGFELLVSDCAVAFRNVVNGSIFGNDRCAPTPGVDCASVDVTVRAAIAASCTGADRLVLLRDGVPAGELTDLGDPSFVISLAHGDSPTLGLEVYAGANLLAESGDYGVRADLEDPTTAFVAGDVGGFTTAASDASVTYGLGDDVGPAAPGFQFHALLEATDGDELVGGALVSLVADDGSGPVPLVPSNLSLPATIGAAPWSSAIRDISLPHGGPYTILATVTDAAGNEATTSFAATIDLVPPDPVALEAIGVADVNPRLPAIDLSFTASADDGASGAPASAYDVRYSLFPITNDEEFELACAAADLPYGNPLPTPQSPGTLDSFTLTGPDPRYPPGDACRLVTSLAPQTIYVAVRAVDDAGNGSTITGGSVQSTPDVVLRHADITATNIVAASGAVESDLQGQVVAGGDLNGDGYADLVLGGGLAHAVCVVYGFADGTDLSFPDLALDGPTGPHHTCIVEASANFLGNRTVAAFDMNGDGIDDLALGAGALFGAAHEVRVYLGSSGTGVGTTPNVTITGMSSFNFQGMTFAAAGNFNGDMSPSNHAVHDLAVASDLEGVWPVLDPARTSDGAVYVVPGNATWDAATTSISIDVTSAADRTSHRIARIGVVGASGTPGMGIPMFGYRMAGVGNVLDDAGATQYDDLAIAQRVNQRTVFVIKGRSLATAGARDILVTAIPALPSAAPEDARVVRLVPESGILDTNFGQTLTGGADLDGGGVPDIVVAHQTHAPDENIHVFWGEQLRTKLGDTVSVSLADPPETLGDGMLLGTNGVILPGSYDRPTLLGDFDDEGGVSTDMAYLVLSTTGPWGSVFVRYDLPPRGRFSYLDLELENPNDGTLAGRACFGNTLAGVGDVNQDGFVDMLVGGADCGPAVLIY